MGPAVILINEKAIVKIRTAGDFKGETVYFHPSFINSKFSFNTLSDPPESLSLSEQQELYLLSIFPESTDPSTIRLNSATYRECSSLFDKVANSVLHDGDNYCPCWMRVVLVSLLIFLLEQEIIPAGQVTVPDSCEGLNLKDIILYLYSNYRESLSIEGISSEFGTNRTTLN